MSDPKARLKFSVMKTRSNTVRVSSPEESTASVLFWLHRIPLFRKLATGTG